MFPQHVVGAVGQRDFDPRFGAQRQLVGVVALDGPVPVEVIGRQRCDGDHARRGDQIRDLVARCLDDPVVGFGLGRGVPGRLADVPPGPGAVAEPCEEVHGQRSRRALALGAGDAGHAGRIGLGHEEAQTPADGDSRRLELRHLRPVTADARALDHHVAAEQRVEPARPRGQDLEPVDGGRAGRVVDQDGHATHRTDAADAGVPLDAQPPDADRRVSERGPGDRWVHSAPGCGGSPAA